MTEQTERSSAGYFAHFLCLRADPLWRRLADEERAQGRQAFVKAVEEAAPDIATTSYSGIGFPPTPIFLWRRGDSPRAMQEMTARLLQTGIGAYLQPTHSLPGFTRPSTYTRRPTAQEQAIEEDRHGEYLVVYPFTKTIDWYLMSREARQGMMNEHMRVGHSYADVSQTLLYATGLTDAEFHRRLREWNGALPIAGDRSARDRGAALYPARHAGHYSGPSVAGHGAGDDRLKQGSELHDAWGARYDRRQSDKR